MCGKVMMRGEAVGRGPAALGEFCPPQDHALSRTLFTTAFVVWPSVVRGMLRGTRRCYCATRGPGSGV